MRNCRFRNSDFGIRSSEGIALIMVLWVVTVLAVVVLEFCFAMRTEVNITKNYKEELQLYAMAEGGIQRAIVELVYKHDPKVQQMRRIRMLKTEEIPPEKKEWVPDGRPYLLPYDQGMCEIRVMNETGKVNINMISETLLRKIIGNLGLDGEARDMVVDSILDWRDPDDFYRVNGAENEYYQSLKEPYNCKNGNLDSIEELLLIRGITPDLFYGKKSMKEGEKVSNTDSVGLKDIFSIFSTGEQIDINSATPIVMRVFLGIPDEVSRIVMKAREEKEFEHQQDLLRRVPELSPLMGEIGRLIVFRPTTPYYVIESKGKSREEGSVRGLKAIIKIDLREKNGYKFIQWVDAVI